MEDKTYGERRFEKDLKRHLFKHIEYLTKNPNISYIDELEFRLGKISGRGFNPKFDIVTFRKLIKYLKRYGQPTETYQLDINLPSDIRVRLTGRDNIQQF